MSQFNICTKYYFIHKQGQKMVTSDCWRLVLLFDLDMIPEKAKMEYVVGEWKSLSKEHYDGGWEAMESILCGVIGDLRELQTKTPTPTPSMLNILYSYSEAGRNRQCQKSWRGQVLCHLTLKYVLCRFRFFCQIPPVANFFSFFRTSFIKFNPLFRWNIKILSDWSIVII